VEVKGLPGRTFSVLSSLIFVTFREGLVCFSAKSVPGWSRPGSHPILPVSTEATPGSGESRQGTGF
jgi:hypothetical protein